MLTQLFNRFKPSCTTPPKPTSDRFRLHKKDGVYSADPKNLSQLDQYEAHKAAAEELNGYAAQFEMVREKVLSLEGTPTDLNPRPDVVAVSDIDVQGKSVDAVLEHSCNFPTLEARVNDQGRTLHMKHAGYFAEQVLTFDDGQKAYKIDDKFDNNYVNVKLTSNR